ncbi:MAG TPA: hypothetical protein DHW61_10750 [Lachnoclostridium phytofermentans]|uniref:Uncharacterized protein n=1 Tax=Lachnoclostridium phytofermentans TaxID=66219 RepID=A0A3D2X6V3_9FIRM|nr:hypothetical protein [Lachnoclostridium phytofermentans]
MPFYEPPKDFKIEINYDVYQTIGVALYTGNDGKITPLKLYIDLPDSSRITVAVDGIKTTKELKGRILFTCVATLHGRKQLFDIIYYKEQGLWVTDKIKSY